MMPDLSGEARGLCARWFAGRNNTLVSDLPHETLNGVQAPMEELLAAGLVTREPWTPGMPAGRIVFKGSAEAARIGREVMHEVLSRGLRE